MQQAQVQASAAEGLAKQVTHSQAPPGAGRPARCHAQVLQLRPGDKHSVGSCVCTCEGHTPAALDAAGTAGPNREGVAAGAALAAAAALLAPADARAAAQAQYAWHAKASCLDALVLSATSLVQPCCKLGHSPSCCICWMEAGQTAASCAPGAEPQSAVSDVREQQCRATHRLQQSLRQRTGHRMQVRWWRQLLRCWLLGY